MSSQAFLVEGGQLWRRGPLYNSSEFRGPSTWRLGFEDDSIPGHLFSLNHPLSHSGHSVIVRVEVLQESTPSPLYVRQISAERPRLVSLKYPWLSFGALVTGHAQLCPVLVRCGTNPA